MADYPSPSSHAFIMLPVNLMNELKLRPVSEVSALEEISDRFLGRYSGIGQHQPTVLNAMRTDLARIANKSIRTLLEDCSAVVATELSDSANGITLTAYSLSNRLISKMIGTMVAGREFGHDEAWLRLAFVASHSCSRFLADDAKTVS